MKALYIIALLAAAGCSQPESQVSHLSQIKQWMPDGSSLASARQVMEQHQYSCSVTCFDSREKMPAVLGADKSLWDHGVLKNNKVETATNISLLTCRSIQTNSDGVWAYEATLTFVNDKLSGSLLGSSQRIQ